MYAFETDGVILEGYNNYALQSLIELCNLATDDKFDKWNEKITTKVGMNENDINEICKLIKKNKKEIANEFLSSDTFTKDEITNAIIDAIKLVNNPNNVDYGNLLVEYMIYYAVKVNEDINWDTYRFLTNEQEKVDFSISRFFQSNTNEYNQMKDYFEDLLYDEEEPDNPIDYGMTYNEDLIDFMFTDIDFMLVIEKPQIAKKLLDNNKTVDDIIR